VQAERGHYKTAGSPPSCFEHLAGALRGTHPLPAGSMAIRWMLPMQPVRVIPLEGRRGGWMIRNLGGRRTLPPATDRGGTR